MQNRRLALAAFAIPLVLGYGGEHERAALTRERSQALEHARPNDNRTPAGRMEGDTLRLGLSVKLADWHIWGDSNPAFRLLAFAEEGKAPTIPAPLIRVRRGTPVRVDLRNPLDDTLIVRGFSERPAARDSLVVLPHTTVRADFVARRPGTYVYWASSAAMRRGAVWRGHDTQLAGALVVDTADTSHDRVFVITQLADRDGGANEDGARDRHGTLLRQYSAINGRGWPYTERLSYALGDSIRWRLVNATAVESHPMHLHGFYFRVDARGTPQAEADSNYAPDQRRMVVTETIGPRQTASIVWSPDQPGGWLFHCHLTSHVAKMPPIDQRDITAFPSAHHDNNPDRHATTGMNGLVLGITVTGSIANRPWAPARRLRLFVQSDSSPGSSERRFGYVLQRGSEPRTDSVEFPGSMLVLTRGEPTSIEVINRSGEATTIHWHGIELESYYDGVAGWSSTSGMPGRTMPSVRNGSSFEVRLTPKRAGTFMYHTHFDEMRQQYGGLVGPLVVLEPGETWDPTRDLYFLISDGVPQRVYINGSLAPPPVDLITGRTYRLRLADIAVFRLGLRVRLVRNDTLQSWRAVAKDGFTLPAVQATVRPSAVILPPGEIADFEFTPVSPGEVVLEVGYPNQPAQGRLLLRISSPVR